MLSEIRNQFRLSRAASITDGGAKNKFLTVFQRAAVAFSGLSLWGLCSLGSPALAADKLLIDMGAPGVEKRLTPSFGAESQVSVARSENPVAPGLVVTIQPGKDGFITSGMLWTPGSVVWYCNGKEIFRWEDPRVSTVPSHFNIEMTTGGWDNNATVFTASVGSSNITSPRSPPTKSACSCMT